MTDAGPHGHSARPQIAVRAEELTYEADGVISIRLARPDGAQLPAWEPGAHIDLILPTGLVRQYSLVESGPDRSWYRIAVFHEPLSRGGSEYVHWFLRPGQLVAVRAPLNHFRLVEAREYRFIAGGIGITPILSMISQAHARGAPWTLHYGGRSLDTMAFRGRLAGYGSPVAFWPADTAGMLPLADVIGAYQPGVRLYCCGPAGLLDAVLEISEGNGWPADAVRTERFKPRVKPASGPDRPVTVIAARSGVAVEAAPGQSLLDALISAGVRVDSSCRNGVCGTCQVRVLAGEPDHRDDVLTSAEELAGDTMLVCVSRARSASLTLDV